MSIKIKAVPTEPLKNGHAPTQASKIQANMTAVGTARAYMQHDPKEGNDGNKGHGLYSRIKGRTYKSTLAETKSPHSEALKNTVENLWKSGNALIKKYWDKTAHNVEISIGHLKVAFNEGKKISQADFNGKIKELLIKKYPGSSNFAINFNDMSARFLDSQGSLQEVPKEALPKEVTEILEFLNSWQTAHETAMKIMNVKSWHSRLGSDVNRPIHGEIPFHVQGKTWENFMPKTDEEFIQKGHLEALLSTLPEKDDGKFYIARTKDFINSLNKQLEERITKANQTDESDIKELKKIKAKLEAINFYAVNWAIANWGSFNPADITQERLSQKAQMITNGLNNTFKANRELNKDQWSLNPLNMWHGKPDPQELTSFAIQTGDLLFHSDLDYLIRFDSSGAKRMVRPSIEEFVINNMMHLQAKHYEDDLSSLNVQLSPKMQKEVRMMINEARSQAKPIAP